MNTIRINEERMKQVLPANIQESEELSNDAKKVLATLLNYFSVLKVAKESNFLICSNSVLRQSVGIKYNEMLSAIQELVECELITREIGTRRKKGEAPLASVYRINWNNMLKPIKKKNTFEELFSDYLKPSENPMGTAITNTITNANNVNVNDIVNVYDNVNNDVDNNVNDNDDVDDELIYKSSSTKNQLKENSPSTQSDNVTDNSLTGVDYYKIEKEIKLEDDKIKEYEMMLGSLLKQSAKEVAEKHNINIKQYSS